LAIDNNKGLMMKRLVFAGFIAAFAWAVGVGAAGAASNSANVRFVQTVAAQPAVDVAVVGGPMLVHDLTYPNASPYLSVAPGTYNIDIQATGTSNVLVQILGWHASAGVSTTVRIIQGTDGHLAVDPMTDLPTTGAASAPVAGAGVALLLSGCAAVIAARRGLARSRRGSHVAGSHAVSC
jgi:hypothetical protein